MARRENKSHLEKIGRDLLRLSGENVRGPGLKRTPQRFSQAVLDLTSGYHADLKKIVNGALYASPGSGMVIVKQIEFYSLCEHHLLPFFGKVHIAYIPHKKIIGLSKLPRIIRMFARRLQVQERLGVQILHTLKELLNPLAIGCVIEAQHLCMMMRGVEIQGSQTLTFAWDGSFVEDSALQDQFLGTIGLSKSQVNSKSLRLSAIKRKAYKVKKVSL